MDVMGLLKMESPASKFLKFHFRLCMEQCVESLGTQAILCLGNSKKGTVPSGSSHIKKSVLEGETLKTPTRGWHVHILCQCLVPKSAKMSGFRILKDRTKGPNK